MEFFPKGGKLNNYRIKRTFKESIEPEEILLDAKKSDRLEGSKLELPINPGVFRIFVVLSMLLIIVLVGRSFYLQVIKEGQYAKLSDQNKTRVYPIFSQRGIIYDQFSTQLVYNVPSFDLEVIFNDLPKKEEERQLVIEKISGIIGLAPQEIEDEIYQYLKKNQAGFVLSDNLSQENVLRLEAEAADIPGFVIVKNIVRQYVDGFYFSHLLGYLGRLNSQDLQNNPDYFLTEKIGKQGLELFYEEELRGQPGKKEIEIDALGSEKKETISQQPAAGHGLILTVDKNLQIKLFDELSQRLAAVKAKRAAAVALNPQNGAVLAMVSLPSFDNNLFAKGISPEDFNNLSDNPYHPLLNHAIAGEYSPGSTIKPMIGAAALEEGIILPQTKISDFAGELIVVNQYDPSIIYRFGDWKAHGVVDIYSAIAESCDVYFYTIGGGYGNIKGLGIDGIKKYLDFFNFGKILGIDLPGEKKGLIPDAVWKEQYKKEVWYTGDTYHLSIGQGDLLATPLQLATAISAIANGGKLYAPYLVDKIVDSDKNIIKQTQSLVLKENFISSKNLEVIRKAMRQTITAGSAVALNDLNVAVAGKTGTAQVAGQKNSNALFVSFAPYENPQIALVILVEDAGEGSQVAAPVAKEVLDWYFNK